MIIINNLQEARLAAKLAVNHLTSVYIHLDLMNDTEAKGDAMEYLLKLMDKLKNDIIEEQLEDM